MCLRHRKGTSVPISRARKEEQVARYAELLSESTGFAIVSPTNLPVNKIEALRRAFCGGISPQELRVAAGALRRWIIGFHVTESRTR